MGFSLPSSLYKEYTELVEPFGIDESWLDVTASRKLFGSGMEIAEAIRQRVKNEIGLTVSIGVSFNKVFAKLGSDYKKPDAITEISRENFKSIVYPLPVSSLLFVGKKTTTELLKIGVNTVGDLANIELEVLVNKFGKIGTTLYEYSRGLDTSPVVSSEYRDGAKSISNGFTFKHDLVSLEQCQMGIRYLCEEIGFKLRANSLKCTTVALTLKDSYLKSLTRQKHIHPPSDIGDTISDELFGILCSEWDRKPVRMITVTASGFIANDSPSQLSFFDEATDEKRTKSLNKEKTIDKLRQKYGATAVVRASMIKNDVCDVADDFIGDDFNE